MSRRQRASWGRKLVFVLSGLGPDHDSCGTLVPQNLRHPWKFCDGRYIGISEAIAKSHQELDSLSRMWSQKLPNDPQTWKLELPRVAEFCRILDALFPAYGNVWGLRDSWIRRLGTSYSALVRRPKVKTETSDTHECGLFDEWCLCKKTRVHTV